MIPHRRYSPRPTYVAEPVTSDLVNSGTDSIVWMREESRVFVMIRRAAKILFRGVLLWRRGKWTSFPISKGFAIHQEELFLNREEIPLTYLQKRRKETWEQEFYRQ